MSKLRATTKVINNSKINKMSKVRATTKVINNSKINKMSKVRATTKVIKGLGYLGDLNVCEFPSRAKSIVNRSLVDR